MEFDFVQQYFVRVLHRVPLSTIDCARLAIDVSKELGLEDWNPLTGVEIEANGQQTKFFGVASPDASLQLKISTKSIDYVFQDVPGVTDASPKDFGTFLSEATKHVVPALRGLKVEIPVVRIAASRTLLRWLDHEGLRRSDDARSNLLGDLGSGEPPFEWDWRFARKVEREFGRNREVGNTIAVVKRVRVGFGTQTADKETLVVSTDVNTDPENTTMRFGVDDVESFLEQSVGWHRDVLGSLEEKIGVAV